MRKLYASLILSIFILLHLVFTANALILLPGPLRINFENIFSNDNKVVEQPAQGYFKVKNIAKYSNIYAYSDTDHAYIEIRKSIFNFNKYPISIKSSSDKLKVCLYDKTTICNPVITTTLDSSKRIFISIDDKSAEELESAYKGKNENKIEDFQLSITVNKSSLIIEGSLTYDPLVNRVAMPYDYYEKIDQISIFDISKFAFISISFLLYGHALILLIKGLRNRQIINLNKKEVYKVLLKLSALILSIFISTLTLSKTLDPTPYFGCFGTEYNVYGIKGLPIPYHYQDTNSGGYQMNFIFMSINYWFWIILFLLIIVLITQTGQITFRFNLIRILKQNIFFIAISITAYLLYFLINVFFGVSIMC